MARDNRTRAEFERRMLPHLNAAHALACWLTRSPQDAQDLVQEAYLKAYAAFHDYAGGDSASWLLAIVRNTCMSWLRRRAKPGKIVRFDEAATAHELRALAAQAPGPDETAAIVQRRERVRAALFELPLKYREVIVLRAYAELGYAQIARVAGVPIGTVMSRLSRGRDLLRKLLAEEDAREQRARM